MPDPAPLSPLLVNGRGVTIACDPSTRLSDALRDKLGLESVKIGCNAGDCGACTVLVEGEPVCSCLVAVGQVPDVSIVTLEGLGAGTKSGARLQGAMQDAGAAQCGICTPGMLLSAAAYLDRAANVDEASVADALGGVLCRCTGYRKIIAAVIAASNPPALQAGETVAVESVSSVGRRIPRLDGAAKVSGAERFGADGWPADTLRLRAIRSPFHHAAFTLGDVEAWVVGRPGVVAVFTARDIPGRNLHGVIPAFADQPVFAESVTRFRGEAVAAFVGEASAIEALDMADFPVAWTEREPLLGVDAALAETAPRLHANRPGNILVRGLVQKGDVEAGLARSAIRVSGEFATGFVEHAPIEPEAGFARRVGDRIEISACTQAPYMDRDDIAQILGIAATSVRILPTATGGGFGAKLDLSVQPFIALAAWKLGRPVGMVYSRPESIRTTTKRHPSRIRMSVGVANDGRLEAIDFAGDFDTGAYASWGPTVANRVPVHASGPYFVPDYRARTRAVLTHAVPSGAFRGFGVPQMAIAQEQLFDEAALKLGLDPLEFRILNALSGDKPTVTGQVLGLGVGIRACFEALRPRWRQARDDAERYNRDADGALRRGVGIAGMWYGCGNTSLSNPSTVRIGLTQDGRFLLHQGAVDIGQGSNTVIPQIAAEALGVPLSWLELVSADTDMTPDCGKTSASRQTFVTGRAALDAGAALRSQLLRLTNAGDDATIRRQDGKLVVIDGAGPRAINLMAMPVNAFGYVLIAEETFDPPTTALDANGQGDPYAIYGFGAHMAEIEVDVRLGLVKVTKITAAHDVGRAINPLLVEGQIEGGVAQGLGLALMEEFTPGRGENLHDYLIPTIGDVPPIESILIEDPSPVGPYGAKGVGEQALIPTAPAILNAIHHATGVRIRQAPATPDRVRKALLAKERGE